MFTACIRPLLATLWIVGVSNSVGAQVEADTTAAESAATPGLSAARELQNHFRSVAQAGYRFTVTVTALRRQQGAPATDTVASRREWVRDAFSSDYPGYEKVASASGFVLSEDGDIYTVRNVLVDENGEPFDLISVETFDYKHSIAEIVALEPTLNLGLIRLAVFNPRVPPQFDVAEFADSGQTKPGDWALVVGNPAGAEAFFARGTIASEPSRDCYQEQLTASYLQTAVVLHPEAFGGPVLDIDGNVIGMSVPRVANLGGSPLMSPYGLEFSLPANIIKGLYSSLKKKKSTRSPWLGIAVMSRAELRKERGPEAFNALDKPKTGILIENTFDPSPATKVGVKPGDWLVHFEGEAIYSPLDFQKLLYLAGIDATVECEFYRPGRGPYKVGIPVEQRPADAITR